MLESIPGSEGPHKRCPPRLAIDRMGESLASKTYEEVAADTLLRACNIVQSLLMLGKISQPSSMR